MFSEYASRFLAQSQSRFSNLAQPEGEGVPRNPNDRYRRANQPLRAPSRGYPQRQGNPYQPTSSHLSNFPFTSRYQAAPDAPLFHSALDDFREEDDEEEQERERADFFALQRSRRVFAPSRLEESSETDQDGSNASLDHNDDRRAAEDRGRGRGIKSSWNGGGPSSRGRGRAPEVLNEASQERNTRPVSEASSRGKGKMVDIGLESTIEDDDPPSDLAYEASESSPPAFQKFRSVPETGAIRLPTDSKQANLDRDLEAALHGDTGADISRPPSSVETVPATIATTMGEAPSHDVFWGSLYLICLGALFATFFLVFLHTSTPDKNLGDTIYTTLSASIHLFAVDTVVSIIVSLIWLALLRSFVKPLVYLILLAVPVILFSFSLYPMISSYKGLSGGASLQDRAMRWLSFVPGIFAVIWTYTIFKGRHSLAKAIGILEFATRILAANPGLLGLGFATLGTVVAWTWMWLGMFTRVFLGGEISKSVARFIINATSWWLGVYFVLMYIWTLSVISGIQRSTTAATVSQWYFHRNAIPAPTSREVVVAALTHATTTLFGTICFSTLLALLIRLPLLVLPRRLVGLIAIFTYSLIPAPIAALTNPLTLTYAAIHSQPLHPSARGLSEMKFLTPQAPTTTLTPRSFSSRTHYTTSLLPYRLAKLLLHATRFIMAMALGFGGWVATARQLNVSMPEGAGIKGSAYAYVVGIVASFIGWGVLGAMEGVLSGIVDASVVCWGSERNMAGGGAYCLEAKYLFGESRDVT